MRPEVAKYIKKKYKLDEGGEMPDSDGELPEDEPTKEPTEEDEDDATDDAEDDSTQSAPNTVPSKADSDDDSDEEPPVPAPAAVPPSKQQAIADYLKSYDDKVQSEQARARRGNMILNLGEALEGVARARSQSRGGQGVNQAGYTEASNQLQQGVQQAQQARGQALQNYMAQYQMNREAPKDQQENTLSQQKIDAGDPTSKSSKVLQTLFKKYNPDLGLSDADLANLSADDITRITPIADTKAKAEMAKQVAEQNRQARLESAKVKADVDEQKKNRTENTKFGKHYSDEENKYSAAVGKIDQTAAMVDQATKGGVASQLVPLEVARGIAGRLNPQEIAAAGGDPSIVDKMQRLFDKAASGQMTNKDAQEYRALLQSQKDTLATVRAKQRDQSINTYANASGQDVGAVRSMVGAPTAQPVVPQPQVPQPSPQDQAAILWLKDHANDPHAAGVAAKLKAKGLL